MLASFSSQHLESHLHDPGNPLYDSITKNHALMKPIRPTGHATVFQSCLLALALAVAGSRSQAAPVPICPLLGSPPYPAYGELDGPPKVETWHELDLQQGPGCIGPAQGPMSLVVALAGRFTHSGSIEDLATRIGAISSTEGLKYWSTTEVRWQVMIAKAFALDDPTTGSARPDFTAAEIFGARSLYFAQDETRTTGTNVYCPYPLETGIAPCG